MPKETPPATPPATPPIENLESQVDQVQQQIDDASNEEVEPKWLAGLNSTLTDLKADLATIKKTQGSSPEIAALAQQIQEMQTAIAALQPSLPPQNPVADAPPSPETKTETSSETPTPPVPEPPPAKPKLVSKRAWL